MKTEEAASIVASALGDSAATAEIVFMFGSVATGYDDDEAEKNLVLIGDDLDTDAVEAELSAIKNTITPELIVRTFNKKEFAKEFLSGKIFIRKSANAPKTFIKGSDNDLWHLYYEA